MIVTRTRLMLIGAAAVLLVLAAACGGALDNGEESGDSGGAASAPAFNSLDIAGDEPAVARSEAQADGEYAYSDSYDSEAEAPRGEGPGSAPQLQGLLDRKIIQSTSVDIEVADVGRDFQEIIRIAQTAGGFVDGSTFSNVEDQQSADITIRVPSDRYQDVLAQLRTMGTVTQESSDSNDVTEEFTDLEARIRTLEATEQRYLELLSQAKTIDEILTVQDRLDGVRGQIEQVQGRINLLEHLTDLGTITVHLRMPSEGTEDPADEGGIHPLEVAADAWQLSLDTLTGIAAGALAVAAFSWWLIPPLAVVGFTSRWWVKRRP